MRCLLVALVMVFGLSRPALPATAADVPLPAHVTAMVLNPMNGRTAALDIEVTTWSTTGDLERLTSALEDGADTAVRPVLDKMPAVGRVRIDSGLASDIRYARQTPADDGGRDVLLVAERWMTTAELMNLSPTTSYPLTVVELHEDPLGTWTGTVWPVARISYWDPQYKLLVVDGYTQQPLRLTAVRVDEEQKGRHAA